MKTHCQRCNEPMIVDGVDQFYWVVASSVINMAVCRDCMEEAKALQRYTKPGHEGAMMIWSPQLGVFI